MEWFRRNSSSSRRHKSTDIPSAANGVKEEEKEEEELFGITDRLIEFVKTTLTLETFKNFPLQDEEGGANGTPATSGNVQKDLSEWQERHAILILSKVKEMSQLRFRLCPGHLKERQFWRIYFTLVKSYVAGYELRAIQLAKLRQMKRESENILDGNACEVEMSETKQATSLEPPPSLEHNSDPLPHEIGSGKE